MRPSTDLALYLCIKWCPQARMDFGVSMAVHSLLLGSKWAKRELLRVFWRGSLHDTVFSGR